MCYFKICWYEKTNLTPTCPKQEERPKIFEKIFKKKFFGKKYYPVPQISPQIALTRKCFNRGHPNCDTVEIVKKTHKRHFVLKFIDTFITDLVIYD
jgi:hypothetical protein